MFYISWNFKSQKFILKLSSQVCKSMGIQFQYQLQPRASF